jgi:hypothetical protein
MELIHRRLELLQEFPVVNIIVKNHISSISPHRDMIDRTGELNSQMPSHEITVASPQCANNLICYFKG